MFKLMEQERKYLDILKETKMLNHVGKGPVDPAPKEKAATTSTDPATGQGTVQAATVSPNQIPKVSDLAKQLAKEGIDLNDLTLEDLAEITKQFQVKPKRTLTQEDVNDVINGGVENSIRRILEGKDCPNCGCNPCKCKGKDKE